MAALLWLHYLALTRYTLEQCPRFLHTNSDIYKALSVLTRSKTQHSFKSYNNSQTSLAQAEETESDKALIRLKKKKFGELQACPLPSCDMKHLFDFNNTFSHQKTLMALPPKLDSFAIAMVLGCWQIYQQTVISLLNYGLPTKTSYGDTLMSR